MRRLAVSIMVFSVLLFGSLFYAPDNAPRAADDPRGTVNQLSGKYADNVIRLVGNLPWFADGVSGDNAKIVYVIYSPTCPISQELYEITRKYTDRIQIRWIPVDMEGGLNGMYEERNADTVRRAFRESKVPSDKNAQKNAAINNYSVAGIAFMLSAQILSPDGMLYFPTLIYGDQNKASVLIGPVENIDGFVAQLPVTKQPSIPEAVTLGAVKNNIVRVTTNKTYVNNGKERVPVRMVPDKTGIEVAGIMPGSNFPLPIEGVIDGGYLAVKVSQTGATVYLYDPDFVRQLKSEK